MFNLEPDPHFNPKMFFSFFLITHFVSEMPSDFECRHVCRANRIFRHYFKYAYFKPKFYFFEILKAKI